MPFCRPALESCNPRSASNETSSPWVQRLLKTKKYSVRTKRKLGTCRPKLIYSPRSRRFVDFDRPPYATVTFGPGCSCLHRSPPSHTERERGAGSFNEGPDRWQRRIRRKENDQKRTCAKTRGSGMTYAFSGDGAHNLVESPQAAVQRPRKARSCGSPRTRETKRKPTNH